MINNFKSNKIEDNRKEIWALSNLASNTSNPNILLNGNFQINQRGKTSYTSSSNNYVYTVDRWRLPLYANISCTISGRNISIHSSNPTYQRPVLTQMVENYYAYAGKTLTFSLKYENLTGKIGLQIDDGINLYSTKAYTNKNGHISITATISSSCNQLIAKIMKFDTTRTFNVDPKEAKLEVGEHATPFSPRPYVEELTLCQRYGFPITAYQRVRANYIYTNSINFTIPTPVTLRATPTFDSSGFQVSSIYNVNSITSGFTFNVFHLCAGALEVRATKTSHGMTEALLNMNNQVFVDCEIY